MRGNGLPLALTREFHIEHDRNARSQFAFGDWDLVLPHLETLTPSFMGGFISGWQVDQGTDPNMRCKYFSKPRTAAMQPRMTPWYPEQWWRGYHLVLPGQGSQDILRNLDPDPAAREKYPAVTKAHWRFSCTGTATTRNGEPGDGFIGEAPDGTKYWFDELVYRDAQGMVRQLDDPGLLSTRSGILSELWASRRDVFENVIALLSGSSIAHATPQMDSLPRELALMLVTKIQDRFGNWLLFRYDAGGRLIEVIASDNRSLSVEYLEGTPRIHKVKINSASEGSRTWTYAYAGDVRAPSLTSVTLPDGSKWIYDLGNFNAASSIPEITIRVV